MKKKTRPNPKDKEKLAQVITVATTPAIIGSLALLYTLYHFSPSDEVFYKTFLLVSLLSIIMPVLFIFFLMRKGRVGNFHMKERGDRALPFGFTLISGIISLLVIKSLESDPLVMRAFLIFFLMALGYSVITFFKYKISGHAFVFTSAILLLTIFIDLRFIYLLLLLIPIGWARITLEEHTLKEVIGGVLYSLVSFVVFSVLISA